MSVGMEKMRVKEVKLRVEVKVKLKVELYKTNDTDSIVM